MISKQISEHDHIYQNAREEALRSWSGQNRESLLNEQRKLRDAYSLLGPRHNIVADLEVIAELLG